MDAMGRLKVGTSITIGTYLLPGYIKKLKQQYPAPEGGGIHCQFRNH